MSTRTITIRHLRKHGMQLKILPRKSFPTRNFYVVDAFCGANKDTRMAIRFIVEVAWQAHFVTNMFIQPTAEELEEL